MKVLALLITMVLMTMDCDSLGAETACQCMSQAFSKGKVEACTADGNFDITQFAKDIIVILPKCFNIPISLQAQLMLLVKATTPLGLNLNFNARNSCPCVHKKYVDGNFESCKGTDNFKPLSLVVDVIAYMKVCQTGN